MPREVKRKRGAPKGNRNALKHGFYSRALDEAEKLDLELATGIYRPHPLGPPLLARRSAGEGEDIVRGAGAPLRRLLPFGVAGKN